MPFAPGQKLAHYEILEPIGKGGMGEVFRAKDTKLGRDVAIKALPEEFLEDEARLARFQREATVLASLNHPNIAAIYGAEHNALVLELVEGPTLADRIAEGPIPIDEALAIARQITEALEAAHEAGIIHRDLKPANVKVRDDGTVKVLDFGLAKALEGEAEGDSSESPTMTAAATRAGVIMGTAAYMSPEQAKGKRVDKRADVWAFGVVLYEMLTGKRAFAGEDVSDTLAFVLTKEPAWEALPRETPSALRQVLRLCLRKNMKRRARDIGDVRLAMDGEFDSAVVAPEPMTSPPSIGVVIGTVLMIGALVGVAVWKLKPEPALPVVRAVATPPASAALHLDPPDVSLAIAPDGTHIVYATVAGGGGRNLHARSLNQLEATPLEAASGGARGPFISPNNDWIGYRGAIARLRRNESPCPQRQQPALRALGAYRLWHRWHAPCGGIRSRITRSHE